MNQSIKTLAMLAALIACSAALSAGLDENATLQSQDDTTSLGDWQEHAQQGDARAQTHIGQIYEDGAEVPRNLQSAIEWYRLAAEQGDAGAQTHLGEIYFCGRGVEQSDTMAMWWFTLAAEQGDARAQLYLGHMNKEGKGIEQNKEVAVAWLTSAAQQDSAEARLLLKFIDTARVNIGLCR